MFLLINKAKQSKYYHITIFFYKLEKDIHHSIFLFLQLWGKFIIKDFIFIVIIHFQNLNFDCYFFIIFLNHKDKK